MKEMKCRIFVVGSVLRDRCVWEAAICDDGGEQELIGDQGILQQEGLLNFRTA